ncbi:MAG TPA: O-antigen ligase family protein, partial [Pyrinomonadaceae bacterium]
MHQSAVVDFVAVDELPVRLRFGVLLDRGLFGSLLLLICVTAIPYGTSQPWWKALFICFVLFATIFAVIEVMLNGGRRLEGARLILPAVVLILFALLQTVSLPGGNIDGLSVPAWNTISADPYQTRFTAMQLIALMLVILLVYRYANTDRRRRFLIHVVLAVAVTSAVYGILRQTVQRDTGFVLPLLRPGAGYGQFINKNHFAYLMEMAFGLGLGLLAFGGVTRKHAMLYVALLLPIWTALVLSNSRGGILAMAGQIVIAVLLLSYFKRSSPFGESTLLRATQSVWMRIGLVIALILALSIGVVWVGGDRLLSNFEAVSREFSTDPGASSGVTRNDIWRATLKTIADHPILGVGIGGYWIAVTEHHIASGTMTPQEAHNDYLELFASGGIVGFAIGVWFTVNAFKTIRDNLRTANRTRSAVCFASVIGLSGALLHSFFDFGLHLMINALVFAILLALATDTA